jgi:hypothetical protein
LHQQDKDARLDAILEQIARNDVEKGFAYQAGLCGTVWQTADARPG